MRTKQSRLVIINGTLPAGHELRHSGGVHKSHSRCALRLVLASLCFQEMPSSRPRYYLDFYDPVVLGSSSTCMKSISSNSCYSPLRRSRPTWWRRKNVQEIRTFIDRFISSTHYCLFIRNCSDALWRELGRADLQQSGESLQRQSVTAGVSVECLSAAGIWERVSGAADAA